MGFRSVRTWPCTGQCRTSGLRNRERSSLAVIQHVAQLSHAGALGQRGPCSLSPGSLAVTSPRVSVPGGNAMSDWTLSDGRQVRREHDQSAVRDHGLAADGRHVRFHLGDRAVHINTNGMTMGSLFKFLWIGNLAGWFFFFALLAIANLFGSGTITLNEEPVSGPVGVLVALASWPIAAAVFTGLQWLFFSLGFGIYSRFRRISLDFKDPSDVSPA